MVAAALGLLAMPIGTAVGIWGLIVLLMPKAQGVFSPDYAEGSDLGFERPEDVTSIDCPTVQNLQYVCE